MWIPAQNLRFGWNTIRTHYSKCATLTYEYQIPDTNKHWKKYNVATLTVRSHCAWHYVYWEYEETGAKSKKKIKEEKKSIDNTSVTESPVSNVEAGESLKIRPTFSKITKKPNTPDLPEHSIKRKNDIHFPIDFLLMIVVTNRGSTAPSWKKKKLFLNLF